MKTRYCQNGEHELSYSREFDAMYCQICDTWDEFKCDDPNCVYCLGRPERPSGYYDK